MVLTYFKRFRMEIDLAKATETTPELPAGYQWLAWRPYLLGAHAEVKYRSFRAEIDANVFPCLGDHDSCVQLMSEISHRDGFLPQGTWLIAWQPDPKGPLEYCGTIQGVCDKQGFGAIQNLGVVPEHRGFGLGKHLLRRALLGFQEAGLTQSCLEVTAQNSSAVRMYYRFGFRKARTLYKVSEAAYV